MKRFTMLWLLAFALAGCSVFKDRGDTYLQATSVPRVQVPAKLDQPDFEDAMVIPPVNDAREISGKKVQLGLPESFDTTYGVDKIVIKKLGDTHWVFLDAPPATVWPKVRQYWEDQHIPLENADPSRGIMETKWLYAASGKPEAVFDSMKLGNSASDPNVATREKFRLRLEPGIRAGSTEIYLEQRAAPIGVPLRSSVDWSGQSDDLELEHMVLSNLAYYLGDHINTTYAVSKGAENIGGEKAELIPDRVRPVLTFRLPFNRAWATVGDALQNAKINVEDLDRSTANYYVYYDEDRDHKPGLIGRLLFHEGKKNDSSENRYLVHLDNKSDQEVNVTIMKDPKTLADADVAEKLLKIIKEFST